MAASNAAGRINRFIGRRPMAGMGRWFVQYASAYGVDPYLLAAIAAKETEFGSTGTGRASEGYGAFGMGPGTRYGGFRQAIAAAAKNLAGSRYKGKTISQQTAMWVLGTPPSSATAKYTQDIVTFYKQMAGHAPKGGVGTHGKGSGKLPKGTYVQPVPTKMGGSDFSYVDAEGAPDRNGTRHHAAHDWFGVEGGLTPVYAPISGRIIESKQATTWTGQVMGGTIKIQAANGMVFVFRHVIPGLKVGQRVNAGKQIARIGKWTDGADHTHVEIWKTLAGGYHYENMIDPVKFFSDHRTVKPGDVGDLGTSPTGGGGGGAPRAPSVPSYQPHYGQDLAMSGSLGSPGQDAILDVGPEPGSVSNMWASLANLPHSAPETNTFANRASMWGGGI